MIFFFLFDDNKNWEGLFCSRNPDPIALRIKFKYRGNTLYVNAEGLNIFLIYQDKPVKSKFH